MKKIVLLVLALSILQTLAYCQEKKDSIKTALLIVDIQYFYFPSEGSAGLVGVEQASLKAKELLEIARANELLVVHIKHKSNKLSEIHKNVEPIENEKVIIKEEVNSFLKTDLLEYLKTNQINRLLVIGMQTHMCLEAAVRAAHDFGFECITIEDACATRDLKFGDKLVKAEDIHAGVLATLSGGGYSKILNLSQFKENIHKYLFEK